MKYRNITIPERFPARTGWLVGVPRRIAWLLVRPYFDSLLRQLADENAALKSDLLATNYRMNWLEEERDRQAATPRGGRSEDR